MIFEEQIQLHMQSLHQIRMKETRIYNHVETIHVCSIIICTQERHQLQTFPPMLSEAQVLLVASSKASIASTAACTHQCITIVCVYLSVREMDVVTALTFF